MKNVSFIFTFTLFVYCSLPHTAWGSSGRLNVSVTGFENNNGHLRIALIDKAEEFKRGGRSVRELEVAIVDKQAHIVFSDLLFGEYAIQLYHDENDNDQLDTFPLFGWPTERYGFSNNKRNSSGRASYEEAKFSFETKTKHLTIEVRGYW